MIEETGVCFLNGTAMQDYSVSQKRTLLIPAFSNFTLSAHFSAAYGDNVYTSDLANTID